MRARRRTKNKAKSDILKYPKQILIDTSTYNENYRTQLKTLLQAIIQEHVKKGQTKVWLEIGMGDGKFINELAFKNPNILCIGIELKEERIFIGIQESEKKHIKNVLFIKIKASDIDEIFSKKQIDTIFMNFPDPWQKNKHIKHRMTTTEHLKKYKKLLKKDGEFILKTDNKIMYEYTLQTLEENHFKIILKTNNLKHDENNIITHFESRYRKKNKPIFKVIAKTAVL